MQTLPLTKEKNMSPVFGVLGIVFGIISVFMVSILFVPLSVLCSGLALCKRDFTNLILGGIGLFLALIGFLTSPILMGLFGLKILF